MGIAHGRCEYYFRCAFKRRYKDSDIKKIQKVLAEFCEDWFTSEDCDRKNEVLYGTCNCEPVSSLGPQGHI